jgi:FtsP/CotA-like multicopper oxidase with cupredoxin domain
LNAKRTLLSLALIVAVAMPLAAQTNTAACAQFGEKLPPLTYIDAVDHRMKGTLYTVSEQVAIPTTTSGTCSPQWVRAYRKDAPSSWNPSSQTLSAPTPGPVLRARVGDMVELTFLNSIDANKFPNADHGCDQTSQYPGSGQGYDQYPDCFAESVFTNVHYHGTHTNPNTTGDNVFLTMSPSPRKHDGTNTPEILASDVQPAFDDFFKACEAQLAPSTGPKIWPLYWKEIPKSTQDLLLNNVKNWGQPGWYTKDLEYINVKGKWPQYFAGAYPYCFKLPNYTDNTFPPAPKPMMTGAHTHGVGSAESDVEEGEDPQRPLEMGQAPGTHWYHAHKHGSTTINVLNGMTGVFIIEGQYDDDINAFYGPNWTRSQPVLVVNQLGSFPPMLKGSGGAAPNFSVNGGMQPRIEMKGGEVQMWRIANTSSRGGIYVAAPPSGVHWMQLAQDGVQFNDVNYQKSKDVSFLAAAGNRVDLLVKAPAYNPTGGVAANTYNFQVYQSVDPSDRPPARAATPQTLLTIVVTAAGTDMAFMPKAPTFPAYLQDITPEEVNGAQTITFASTALPATVPKPPSQHFINGKQFDGSIGASVLLNQVQEWKVVNETYPPATGNQISHPFHIHINPFQIFELFDPNAVVSSANGPGTVGITAGTATVTGDSATTFTKTFVVGDFIWIGTIQPAQVIAITDDHTLTINFTSNRGVAAGTIYQSAIPLYTVNSATARATQCVLNPKDRTTWHPCPGKGFQPPQRDAIWWDVFSIPSGNTFYANATTFYQIPGYFKMRSRFVDYFGEYVMHCHILAHEDRGMMTVVKVDPVQSSYSHH